MDRLADESEIQWMPLLYGVAAGLSSLIVVQMLVWIFHYRGGFAWQDVPALQFNWHPLLMVISLIILYGHGILVYRLLRNERKRRLKLLHAAIMISALLLASIGLKAVFDSHNLAIDGPYPNLYTLHSWLGLATVIFFALQWLFGFVSFLFPGIRHSLRSAYMPLHIYGGLLIFGMATATALMGFLEKALFTKESYDPLTPQGILMNSTGLTVAALSMVIFYITTRWQYKRMPLPEDELLLADQLAE